METPELQEADPKSLAEYWKAQLQAEEDAHKDWRDMAEEAEDAYEAERRKRQRYNIFWSNVQIQKGALYQGNAQPEVRRRQTDQSSKNSQLAKIQKDAATVLERGIDFCQDTQDFDGNVGRALCDVLITALGQCRVKYKPTIEEKSDIQAAVNPMTGTIEMQTRTWEEIVAQQCEVEFFSWSHFHFEPCKAWEFVNWVAFDNYKSKEDVKAEFNVQAEEDAVDEDGNPAVKVTEIFYKPTRTVIVIGDQFSVPLAVRPDGLGLANFFPCPKPMVLNLLSQKFVPKPDFWFYQDQARELNKTVTRIDNLVGGMKDVGFYDAYLEELGALTNKKDGALVPVQDLAEKVNGRGLDTVIHKKPIEETMRVVVALQQHVEAKKQEIYEITGLADIVRGATDPRETKGAQHLKGQFASVRIRDKIDMVAIFVRDIYRIMGEIIAEHFEPEVLTKMTGIEVTPEIEQILRDDAMRSYSIDVESNSTLAQDEREEQAGRLEALSVITEYMQGLFPAMQNGAIPMELGRELLLMSIRGFKYAGNVEDMISRMGEDNPEQAMFRMQQEMRSMQEEMEAMRQELAKTDELDNLKKEADIINKNAQTAKTKAETAEQRIENAGNLHSLTTQGTVPFATG